jgi:pyruvate,water dikinase
MWNWLRRKPPVEPAGDLTGRVRAKYHSFRELLTLNNEALELMAGLQEDLQFVPPRYEVLEGRIEPIFERINGAVGALDRLTGIQHGRINVALQSQLHEIERYAAHQKEFAAPRLSAWLSEINLASEHEAGAKAAYLGEVRNKLGLPVPEGFVLTTEAYRQYCGIPLWRNIRDAEHDVDPNDLDVLRRISASLSGEIMALPIARAIEVAIESRSQALLKRGGALAVRSSGVGEGGAKSYAGQFLSILNVMQAHAVDAFREVIAGRFSERALSYRMSTGLLEVDSPMAVLFLLMVPARAAGIMYTRDPSDHKSKALWVNSTRGLGQEIASGRMPADLFVVSRARPHPVIERKIARKEEELVVQPGGGITPVPLSAEAAGEPSLREEHLSTLAGWALAMEDHFKAPQDIEWVLDLEDRLWIVQSRPLAGTTQSRTKLRQKPKADPILAGGRTIYPGRTSGPAYLLEDYQKIGEVPDGAVLFIPKPSPEIIQIFPRIAGLVAEWGNVAGHAAALLREFQIPSVFEMTGASTRLKNGDLVSLDAVQGKAYGGTLWPPQRVETSLVERFREHAGDPVSRRLLTLHLLDPTGHNFHPGGCESGHDVLRYCHEKAIGAMFEVNDFELERGARSARELSTRLPLNILVLDLGGGIESDDPANRKVKPENIVSRPFQELWKGVSHPAVSWTREMPAAIGDLASVLASSLTPRSDTMRGLGEKSYLLVASEYMNLNSRLAYHFSLIDACLSDIPANNYISFRFEGGGSTSHRRSLRACFIEKCLANYGFNVDRRGDLVNAWLRKAPYEYTAERLDILGRLMACASQLDMYMNSREMMNWYVRQFVEGNYSFRPQESKAAQPV